MDTVKQRKPRRPAGSELTKQRHIHLTDTEFAELSRYAAQRVAEGREKRLTVSRLVVLLWEDFKDRHNVIIGNGGNDGAATRTE